MNENYIAICSNNSKIEDNLFIGSYLKNLIWRIIHKINKEFHKDLVVICLNCDSDPTEQKCDHQFIPEFMDSNIKGFFVVECIYCKKRFQVIPASSINPGAIKTPMEFREKFYG